MLVIRLAEGTSVSGVFTTNAFCAAPVRVCRPFGTTRQHPRPSTNSYTGCANAGTGALGLANAEKACAELAQLLGIKDDQVLPFSTGVILEHLPMDRLLSGLPVAIANLKEDNWYNAAQAIMTTDTLPKAVSKQITLQGKTITLTGISKGAGMIKPNMATMLGYLATDAGIAQTDLDAPSPKPSLTAHSTASPSTVTPQPMTHSSSWPQVKAVSCLNKARRF